ncbi:MAG: hypothetical protein HFJ06_11755 [Lachnospiraceae bacterium]|nr:hypothetical protein [Lachnospiraceae bacterium]
MPETLENEESLVRRYAKQMEQSEIEVAWRRESESRDQHGNRGKEEK